MALITPKAEFRTMAMVRTMQRKMVEEFQTEPQKAF